MNTRAATAHAFQVTVERGKLMSVMMTALAILAVTLTVAVVCIAFSGVRERATPQGQSAPARGAARGEFYFDPVRLLSDIPVESNPAK